MVAGKLKKKFAFVSCVGALFLVSYDVRRPRRTRFRGVWLPDINDQNRQETAGTCRPGNRKFSKQVQHLIAEERPGGRSFVLGHCLPHGMPSWMLITPNAFGLLTTPGRITMLGEVDGNRMRRIYLDGRKLPRIRSSLHGSIPSVCWDGDTLVVDTHRNRAAGLYRDPAERSASATAVTCTLWSAFTSPSQTCCMTISRSPRQTFSPRPGKRQEIFRRYPGRHYEITEGE